MSFTPLKIAEDVPAEVSRLIESQIEMQFKDMHTMLRLPIKESELEA